MYEYLVILAVCNACVIAKDETTGEVKYQAESPDEVALTLFASMLSQEFFLLRMHWCHRVSDVGFIFLK